MKGLKFKILAPMICIAAGSTVCALVLVMQISTTTLAKSGTEYLLAKAQTLSDAIEGQLKRVHENTTAAAQIPLVLSVLAPDSPIDPAALQTLSKQADGSHTPLNRQDAQGNEIPQHRILASTLLHNMTEISKIYELLYVSDDKGNILASSDINTVGGMNISTRNWFQRALTEQRTVFSDPFTSKFTGEGIIVVSHPIQYGKYQGTLTGSLRLQVIIDAVLRKVEQIPGLKAVVIKDSGLVIGSLDASQVLQSSYSDMPWIGQLGTSGSGTLKVEHEGVAKFLAFSHAQDGIISLVSIAASNLHAPARQVLWVGIIAMLFAIGLTCRVLYTSVDKVTKDVDALARYASHVAAGEKSRLENFNRTDEMGILAGHIVHMVYALQQSVLKATEANRLKNEFIANMSHELRTPLNAVLGMCALCLRTPVTGEQRTYLQKAQTSAVSLLDLVNDLLDFAKLEANILQIEHKAFSLLDMLNKVISITQEKAAEKNLALDVHIDKNLPSILVGDAPHTHQVLHNLLDNAVKFTEKGGVTVRVQLLSQQGQQIQLYIAVKDSGMGISAEMQEHLFQPFMQADGSFTRRYGGSGLGLALSSQLLERMGSKLEFQSSLQAGSEFSFVLPLSLPDEANLAKSCSEPNPPADIYEEAAMLPDQEQASDSLKPDSESDDFAFFTQLKVLVVEDNELNQEIALTLLESMGFVVDLAENGQVGVEAFTQKEYDLILMDIQMPVMDGLEATRRIRSIQKTQPPIIALTAHGLPKDKQRSFEVGMDAHITKPYDFEYFRKVLRQCIEAGHGNIPREEIFDEE